LAVVTLAVVDVRRRWTWSALAVLVLAAVATGSLTAIVACIVGLFALAVIASGRAAVKAGAAVLLLTIMTVMAFAPLRERLTRIRTLIASGDYAEAFSGRVTPFLAAGEMLTKHPVTGVGPGCFAYEYFPYKVAVEQKHPRLLQVYAHHFNFGQAHNDHLQILAECGVVGYLIALAVLVIIARGSLGQREDAARPTAEFSRHLSLPLAAALATLCVAHFPLHLTAATVAFAFVAALCAAWSEPARVPQGAGLPHAPRAVPKLLRYAVVAASVAVAIPAFNRLVVAPYRCNIAKPRIQRTTMQVFDSSSFAREPTARANIALLRGFLETRRSDVDLYMLLAANERILARNEDAIATYTRALAFDKRPEIYYNIGMLHLGNGRRGEAITNLYQAVLFDRTFMDDVPYEDVKAELAAILARATNSTTTATGS
jgi:tetratricopeptide (TPR) repeat protein